MARFNSLRILCKHLNSLNISSPTLCNNTLSKRYGNNKHVIKLLMFNRTLFWGYKNCPFSHIVTEIFIFFIIVDLVYLCLRNIFSTNVKFDLMEFFDDKKNWGANEVKSGRSWRKEELRLKSNSDLHKLWYVLLKERNMLLTMEQEAKDQVKLFPSPERIDKVEESMENLESVVRERNVAYHQLETGETGERPGKYEVNAFGLNYYHKMREYDIPKHMNKKWHEKYKFYKNMYDRNTEQFLLKYREKLYLQKRRKRARDFNHVIGLLNRFPNMDMEALKEQYPDVDIEKAKLSRKYGGHFAPK